jgi:hypothetical protein
MANCGRCKELQDHEEREGGEEEFVKKEKKW